MNFEKEPTNL